MKFTVLLTTATRIEVLTLTARNWYDALNIALNSNLWATRGEIAAVDGKEFDSTIYC